MLYEWLQLTAMVVGFITIFSVISGLFFAFDKGPKRLTTNNPMPSPGSEEFLVALSRTVGSRVEQGGSVKILNNGDEFFPALIKAISHAERNINFTVYIWQDGNASDQILEALIERQTAGIQVRVLLDAFGSGKYPKNKFKNLVAAGGKVEKFRTLQFGKLTRYHRRSHRRAIIIDGKIGFTGGISVKDCWLGNAQNRDHWRDMMFQVSGPMASSLQTAFTDLWASSCGEILFGAGIYPLDILEANSQNKFVHLASSPTESMVMQKFLLFSMMSAREKLLITTPYFIPDAKTVEVLKAKAKDGIDIRIMLPNGYIDNHVARWNAQNFYHDLLESGIRIFEYQKSFIHSKYLVVDGTWSIFGSPNQNFRSRNLDEENAFGVANPILAKQLEDTFQEDAKVSKEITLKTWRKRGLMLRYLVFLSRIIEEQS